jgi:hypothetical protein
MSAFTNVGEAILTSTDATTLLGNITDAVSDNIAVVLVIVGGVVGITWARGMINRAVKRGRV